MGDSGHIRYVFSPHDHPQSVTTIKRWYDEIGFENVTVGFGPNGVIAKMASTKIMSNGIIVNELPYL